MGPTHVVMRPFPGPGGLQIPGTEVDASEWRNASSLVQRRYLRPIERPAERIPTPRPMPAARPLDPTAEPVPVSPPVEVFPSSEPEPKLQASEAAAASRKKPRGPRKTKPARQNAAASRKR